MPTPASFRLKTATAFKNSNTYRSRFILWDAFGASFSRNSNKNYIWENI